MSSESRRNPRFVCAWAAVIDGPRGALRGTCTNISLGGAYVSGPSLPIGATCTMTIELGARGTLRLTAQVRHQSPAGMGVQFTRFEPGQVDVLQQLIASLPR